jgi:CheY-like chemotaxis protein
VSQSDRFEAEPSHLTIGHRSTPLACAIIAGMTSREEFARQVRDVLGRLDDRPFLRSHPLARLISPSGLASPEQLRRAIVEAIEELRPPGPVLPRSHGWRRYLCLRRRYVDGVSPEEIARELVLSERQARREHQFAIEALAVLLYEQHDPARTNADASLGTVRPASRAEPSSGREPTPDTSSALDQELSRATADRDGEPTSVTEAIAGAARTVRGLAASRQVALDVASGETLPPVAVQRVILRNIILGLLSHAIGRGRGTRIELRAAAGSGSVRVRIVARRAARPDAAPSDGLPLAQTSDDLTVARRLAESQTASIEVESPDAGSVALTLTLPIAREYAVVLVDDNPDLARLFQRYLEGTSYRLYPSRTGAGALRRIRELRPDIIVLDLLLQSEDGWEVLENLKGDSETRGIPVVICSVLPDRLLALSLGVADFLPKPVSRESLLATLDRCRPLSV